MDGPRAQAHGELQGRTHSGVVPAGAGGSEIQDAPLPFKPGVIMLGSTGDEALSWVHFGTGAFLRDCVR